MMVEQLPQTGKKANSRLSNYHGLPVAYFAWWTSFSGRLSSADVLAVASSHVEVVSLLQRMSNTLKKTITLDVDMEDYHRIKSEGR